MSTLPCAVAGDIGRFARVQQNEQNHEFETERLADELVDLTLAELLYRIDTACRDSDRLKTDRSRLRDLYEEIDGLVVECAEYRV